MWFEALVTLWCLKNIYICLKSASKFKYKQNWNYLEPERLMQMYMIGRWILFYIEYLHKNTISVLLFFCYGEQHNIHSIFQ